MTNSELYLPNAIYAGVVGRLTRALAAPNADALVTTALLVDGLDRPGVAEALLTVERSPVNGEFDACDVKRAIGEEGNIWPESIRADAQLHDWRGKGGTMDPS